MIKKNKTTLIVTSLIILLPALFGLAMWNRLPEMIATHWNFSNEIDGYGSRAFAVFGIPLIMLAVHWLCFAATCLDKRNVRQNSKPLSIVLYIIPVVSILSSATVYSAAIGMQIDMMTLTPALMGLMFIAIGNYMPKCRLNATLGIKIYWTLANEENWNRTHRFGGRLWVAGGAVLLLAGFLPNSVFTAVMIAGFIVMILAPMLYSYLLYRRQKAEGTWEINGVYTSPRVQKIGVIIPAVVLILAAVLMFTGNISYEFGEDSFRIDSIYWSASEIAYADVTSIEYRDAGVDGLRTSGFGSARLLMGQFSNDEFGYYTRYTYTGCDEAIVLTVGDRTLVVSAKDPAATQALYGELTARIAID